MSELHSESFNSKSRLTVRIKLVNLNHTGIPGISVHPNLNLQSGMPHTVASASAVLDRASGNSTDTAPSENRLAVGTEICIANCQPILSADFESHIEECPACSNRVELQLDFMQTLEVAVYQRKADRKSKRISGALLVSAPELNFAICGELER